MRVSRVKPVHVGQFLFARIETDTGLVGWGESGCWGHIAASAAALDDFAAYLVGKDPRPIERHWNVLHRFAYFQGAAISGAISAVDIALWDIKGQALGVPVHELLGGACRTRARLSGHAYAETLDGVVAQARALVAAGYTAISHFNPLLDPPEGEPFVPGHAATLNEAVANLAALREAVGPDIDIGVELHRRLTPAEAKVFLAAAAPFRPIWVEDPIRPENIDAMAALARGSTVPIATGERFVSIQQFDMLLARRGVDVARICVCSCGGITGARKAAVLCEAKGVMVAPHNPLSPIGLAACLQLAAAIPNFLVQEVPTGFEGGRMESGLAILGADIASPVPRPTAGYADIPDGPGLGIALLTEAAAIRPPLRRPISMRGAVDGAPVDQ